LSLTREQRAERAHQILQDDLYKESLAALKDVYTNALRGCAAKDDLGRFRYAVALDVIDGVQRHLEAVLVQGKIDPKQGQEFQTDTMVKRLTRIF
jgi:hypothetical protein